MIERAALGARVIALHLEVSRDDFAALKLYPRAVITTAHLTTKVAHAAGDRVIRWVDGEI